MPHSSSWHLSKPERCVTHLGTAALVWACTSVRNSDQLLACRLEEAKEALRHSRKDR